MKVGRLFSIVFVMLVMSVIVSGCSNSSGTPANNTPTPNASKTTAPAMVWQHRYGGPEWDAGDALVQTDDGGYAILGMTTIPIPQPNDTKYHLRGYYQMLLLKTDSAGNELWNKTFGNPDATGTAIIKTADGGFTLLGYDDVSSSFIVRTDASGNKIWNKTYDWREQASVSSFVQADDGGYMITGGKGHAVANYKVFMVKTDASGNVLWNRTYNHSGSGFSIIKATDGGYAILGNGFIIKTDACGNEIWYKDYKSGLKSLLPLTSDQSALVVVRSIVPDDNGGYAFAGSLGTITVNVTGDQSGNKSLSNVAMSYDMQLFLTKVDATGNILWTRTFGGPGYHEFSDFVRTNDGGYALAGLTNNNTTVSVTGSFNISAETDYSIYLVKADKNGNEQWEATYRVDYNNQCKALVQAQDGGYVLTGETKPKELGTYFDLFLVKVM